MNLKKVTIVTFDLGYGGVEKIVCDLANKLVSNYVVEVVVVYKIYQSSVFKLNSKVKVTYLTNLNQNKDKVISKLKSKSYCGAFIECLKSLKIIITKKLALMKFASNCDSDIIITTRYTLNKYFQKKKHLISWEHNHPLGNEKYIHKICDSCKSYDYLVVVSKEIQKIYLNFFAKRKINCKVEYIPNFLNEIPQNINSLNNKNIVSVGRFEKQKGYWDLIKIMEKIQKIDSKIVLHLVGDGSQFNEIKSYIIEHKIRNIILYGYLSEEQVKQVYKKCSLYLMTSIFEPFGIVMIEAMSYGIPVIAFDTANGANEIINNNVNGYIVKNRNEELMIRYIIDLFNNSEKLKKFGKAAFVSSKKYFSNNVIKQWINIFNCEIAKK